MKSKKKQKTLKENVDYTITYKNNIDVHNGSGSNAPSIVLNGIGDFSGAIRKNFIITPKDIKNVTIEPIGDMIYTGMDLSGQVKEAIVVRDGNSILNPERDYTVSFFTGKKGTVPVYNVTGTYMQDTQMRVVITAKTTGNYKGTAASFSSTTSASTFSPVSASVAETVLSSAAFSSGSIFLTSRHSGSVRYFPSRFLNRI